MSPPGEEQSKCSEDRLPAELSPQAGGAATMVARARLGQSDAVLGSVGL